tara:strand:+ start:2127 stop:2348 length:222 start_codon:yes stop_codon:yes gene_type:complete
MKFEVGDLITASLGVPDIKGYNSRPTAGTFGIIIEIIRGEYYVMFIVDGEFWMSSEAHRCDTRFIEHYYRVVG